MNVIPNDHTLLISKFSEKRWIDKIITGELSFSCAGAFINQAKRTGNTVQGDELEAVFARLKTDDPRIDEMQRKLGRDLEIIADGDYCYLRRKSAKFKPIFCFYSYKAIDLLNDGKVDSTGYKNIRHDFDERMYSGFTNGIGNPLLREEYQFRQIFIQPQVFKDRIKAAHSFNGVDYIMKNVDYDLRKQDEFFIEPTNSYEELFHKSPEYEYQYEGRIMLKDMKFGSIADRFTYKVQPLKDADYKISTVPLYMEFGTVIDAKKP